jgi:hypothetical protein
MVFTIKRAQIRTHIAKIAAHYMSSISETSKCRRTWPLATLRHTPTALGTYGALGVGWNTPRSVKVGHAPARIMPRPPRRHFTPKCVLTRAKFRLPSTGSLKNKTSAVRGGGGVVAWGGGCFWSVFCPRETHTRRLFRHYHTHSQKTQFSVVVGEDKISRPMRT